MSRKLVRPPGIPDDAILRIVRVPPESAGKRVDVFLQAQLRNTSRTRSRSIIEKSGYSLDGRKLRASDRVRSEECVVLWRPPLDEKDAAAELPILYEDDHLLVVDKPPLMTVHPTARHHHHTVIKLLEVKRPGQFLSLIHRLDRETSGVLMIAKTREADRAFKRSLEERSLAIASAAPAGPRQAAAAFKSKRITKGAKLAAIEKTYQAITWGIPESGTIDLPLEPDVDNPLRVKMRTCAPGTGLESHTIVNVRESRADYALLECRLLTGRQHQIRVHLAAVGCPVVGDKLYGPDDRMLARAADGDLTNEDLQRLELPRHALHNHRYCLDHAVTGERLELESPLADDLASFWDAIDVR